MPVVPAISTTQRLQPLSPAAALAGRRQIGVGAQGRDIDAGGAGGGKQRSAGGRFDLFAVYRELHQRLRDAAAGFFHHLTA